MARTFDTCQQHAACVMETGERGEVHHDSDGNDAGGFVASIIAEKKPRRKRQHQALRRRLARLWRWTKRHVFVPVLKGVSQAAWKVSVKTAYWCQLARS